MTSFTNERPRLGALAALCLGLALVGCGSGSGGDDIGADEPVAAAARPDASTDPGNPFDVTDAQTPSEPDAPSATVPETPVAVVAEGPDDIVYCD